MTKLKEKQNISEDWKEVTLEDLMVFERPDNYIVKSSVYSDSMPTPVLTANKSFILGYTDEDFGIYNNLPAVIFDDFTTDSKYVDFPFKIKSSAIKILKSKDSTIADLKFLYEIMKLTKFPTGNHKRYYISQYQKQTINLPPLKEQQRIAEILGAVDEDIEKTKATIKATEKLKRGLMQELFTRGIGHTKFKQTELGEIPESWEVGGFQNFVDPKDKNAIKPGPFGSALKKEFYVPTGYKIYGQEQVIKNNPYFGNYYINEEKYKSLEGFKIQPKDLLISLVGTIGKTMIIPDDAELGIINPRLLKITVDHSKASVYFVDYLLKGFSVLRQTTGKSHGGTMSILNKGMLLSVKIPVPSKDEQEKIARILLSVDEKISINKKLLAKQTELKKGLMQDLLSGKKRVV